MAQEYKLTSFEASDYKTGQNYWCTGVFEGVGEPVKIVTPTPQKWVVGDSYYGEVLEAESKSGNTYLRFKREARPEGAAPTQTTLPQTDKPAWRDNSDGQRQGMCINNATSWVNAVGDKTLTPEQWAKKVHDYAQALYEAGDLGLKVPDAPALSVEEQVAQEQAKRDAERIRQTFTDGSPVPDMVHDFQEEEPINLDEIPY